MRTDFSEPKRQSASGVAIMFANHLQRSIRILIFPIILMVVRVKSVNPWYIVAVVGILLIGIAIYSYLSYLKFTFFLNEQKQEFIIDKGILNREHLTIRLDKIQQVNINQSLLQRMIGVYSLDIDTAGSDQKEASIKAIDHETATILRARLLSRTTAEMTNAASERTSTASAAIEGGIIAVDGTDRKDPDWVNGDQEKAGLEGENQKRKDQEERHSVSKETMPNSTPFLKLSIPTLYKVGLTSNYGASFALLGGFVYAIMESMKNYTEAFELSENPIHSFTMKGLGLVSLCILFVMALLVLLATNIVRNFIKYFDFNIVRRKNFLSITSGLFDKRHTLLKPARVQIATYSQNYFQKKLNLLNMKIKQASHGNADESDDNNKKHDIDIPGCNDLEREEILKMIFNQLPVKEHVFVPNYRFLFKTILFVVVFPSLFFIGAATTVFPVLKPYFGLIIPYALIAVILLYFEFRSHRLYLTDGFIIKKSGIWDIEHHILEPHKIQSITTKQYFWHKKAGIGHLMLHTAAGTIHFNYGNYADIHRMANYWLYKLESGKKDWM